MSRPGENLVSRLERLAGDAPHRVAIAEPGGRQITYAELERSVARLSGGLSARGLGRNDRVLLLMPMSIPLYIALLGLWRAGCTAVLVDPSAPSLEAWFNRISLRGFIGSPRAQLLRLRHAALRGLPFYATTGASLLPAERLERVSGPIPRIADVGDEAPALLTFTSGSTGAPKALGRTHAFLALQQELLAQHLGLHGGDIDLPTLPVFLLNSLAAGATCVLPDADLRRVGAVRPERVLRQLRRWRCTVLSGSPAFLGPIVKRLRSERGTLDSVRSVFLGGAPVSQRTLADTVAAAPHARVELLYGASEAEPIATLPAAEAQALFASERHGSGKCVGRPVAQSDVRIVRPGSAETLDIGSVGEVVVGGSHVSLGYFEDPAADHRHKLRDGQRVLHRTGDTGYLDAAGRLWLVGRVGTDVDGRHPLAVELAAEANPWIRRAAWVDVCGRGVLACEVAAPPRDWRAQLEAQLGVSAVVALRRLPVDRRHNAKIDRPRVRTLLGAPAGRDPQPVYG